MSKLILASLILLSIGMILNSAYPELIQKSAAVISSQYDKILSSTELSDTVSKDDLVFRNKLFFKKLSDVPFTGRVKGVWEGELQVGKREGIWREYFITGELWKKGSYQDGYKVGIWEQYSQKGVLISKDSFNLPELMKNRQLNRAIELFNKK